MSVERRTIRIEEDMDVLIGYILLIGVVLSVVLLIVGIAWNWTSTGNLNIVYRISVRDLYLLIRSAFGRAAPGMTTPHRLINLGIAVLMLTPFVRVLASVFFFALAERNWKYTVFTLFVLSVLTYALFFRAVG